MDNQTESNLSKAVVLLNFGGPSNLEIIPEFLFQILSDPETLRLPIPLFLQRFLARLISNKRATYIRKQYEAIGGKSPILEATENQKSSLEVALEKDKSPTRVFIMYRYISGNANKIADLIVKEGFNNLLLVPLYPHYSWSTVGSSIFQCLEVLEKSNFSGEIRAIRSYPNHPDYIKALSHQINKTIANKKLDPKNTRILCSAHGLPQSYVDQGDPYLMELYQTLEELRKNFSKWNFQLCFQSRAGRAEWLKPYTDLVIPKLSNEGVKSILFVPISFVNDHLETLYEIDHTYFNLARENNLDPYRVPALETHPTFIKMIADQVVLWKKGLGGLDPKLLLPPSQKFQRQGQWILGLIFLSLVVHFLQNNIIY